MATRKLLQSTAVTGGMTLISRITGLIRDLVFAGLIGAGLTPAADAFYVAFRIPNFLRRIFGEGALSQAFVPVYAEYRAKHPEKSPHFVDRVTGVLAVALFVVTAVGVIAAPLLIVLLAPGYLNDPTKYDLTVTMLQIMFPYLFFVSLVALAAGILNTHGRFGAAAFTPVLLNVSLIGAAVWLAPRFANPVVGLAWGVFLAGVVQLLFQVPFLARIKALPRPVFDRRDEGVRRVGRLMLPAIFGVSVAQINLMVNTILASFLVTGSISWLYYADRLMEFPLGVFGIALATVILPQLSHRHVSAAREDFSHLLDWGLRWVFIIGVPASAALIVLAGPLLSIFQFGAFQSRDVIMSAQALMAFALGLVPLTLVKVLAPGFYARQDTKTPVRIGMIALYANVGFSLLLVYPLKHAGLALSTTLAAFVNAGLLYRWLRIHGVYQVLPGWRAFLARVTLATGVMTVVLYLGAGEVDAWLGVTSWERVMRLALWIPVGLLVYGALLWMAGMRLHHLKLYRHV